MASYNPSGGNDHLREMLARLQQGRTTGNAGDDSNSHNLLSRFATLNQATQSHGDYYGGGAGGHLSDGPESPLMTGSEDFPPPAAPTPPMSHFSHSHGPPGMHLGPIGSLPPSSSNHPDQTASLLNLLKYKNGGGGGGSAGGGSTHSSPHSQRNSQTAAPGPPSFDYEASVNVPQSHIPPTLHAPVPMPADPQGFLASLMKGDSHHESSRQEAQAQAQAQSQATTAGAAANKWNPAPGPTGDTQAYLLNLLQRKKPSQTDQPLTNGSSQPAALTPPSTTQGSTRDQMRDIHLSSESPDGIPSQTVPLPESDPASSMSFPFLGQQHSAPSPPTKPDYGSPASQNGNTRKTMFDYKDPFDDLIEAPSPHNRTPKSVTSGNFAPSAIPSGFQILRKAPSTTSSPGAAEHKRLGSHRSPAMTPEHVAPAVSAPKRFQSNGSVESRKETVSTAVENLAGVADEEAQEALARAEHEEAEARIARELEDLLAAKSGDEFERKSEIVARDIRHELEREENAGILENSLPAELAQAVHDIVDEAANDQPVVADSWESAEADEIVVIEEVSTPVKVYNFPMKPWISITLQDNEEPRPQFRDDVILDIARVKKEFDQIDRNLVSATETYIIYGMSKAGGLRVIRQDDGRDAKLFTDTRDRIFNVSVSSTPADLNSAHKESIIGTGISGTVYYTMIKNGDKDYLDETHPEQYGFALPPVSTQEGDAPGGVLKTRARTSSTHPEYFAVGRGKTISIVWPSYIMQHNLFKPGHDRVVDTEKLSKQCSLRINTGKAGKDFTFSQDDTTIVSLDKSGRVKFWDVRDLTAADEDSDPRFPTPAQTSLEVKEPLMTLTTTPENEKAWPTSVILLDKQRPYQKRCALRYMIVGMKQNHTLQLWDLALGKPVQEFNLPHSKESDAVCSVMYHPPTGMIVVGHPTRNSVYFLHLSAPKYTIKGLSQVDFIQKLVARDSSIPEPDSTAVISGVREYSFSNKGVIRSLDMLGHPAASAEDDEQTLFELYAMHSKGVSGICVKQHELGWTKDNKVVAPVDALEMGIVKITKLKELPAIQTSEVQNTEEVTSLPIRTAGRPTKDKENMQPTSGEDVARKTADEMGPPAAQNERKTAELPVTPLNTEKAERRSRKKKEKAAAAAAERALLAESGTSQSPQKNAETKLPPAPSQPAMSAESLQAAVKQVETTVSNAIEQAMKENRQKVDSELRGRDVAFKKSQQNLLEVVSAALDTNVQRVLTATITDQIDQRVVPSMEETLRQTVTEQISRTVSDQLDAKIGGRVSHAIQNQMQKLLPNAVGQALLKPDLAKSITKQVSEGLADDVLKTFHDALHSTITPAFGNMAVAAADRMILDVQKHAAAQIEELEQKIHADSNKIDQLTSMVTQLSDMVGNLSRNQMEFQSRYEKAQEETARERQSHAHTHHSQGHRPAQYAQQPLAQQQSSFGGSQASSRHQPYASPSANSGNQLIVHDVGPSKEQSLDRKLAELANQVDNGELEGALVRWLQSDRKEEIFGHFFAKLDARMVRNVSPLVGLAVIAELSRDLNSRHLREKIYWMSSIIGGLSDGLPNIVSTDVREAISSSLGANEFALQDGQVHEVIPNILGGFISQMETLYGRVSIQLPGGDPILHHISTTVSNAKNIIDAASRSKIPDF
ncbi:hypothetical protein SCUP515_11681 [Seiridium cupressi]